MEESVIAMNEKETQRENRTQGKMVLSLAVPNVALCFTENTPLMADVVGVLLPLSLYALIMSVSRNVGRMVWILFLLVFFAAVMHISVHINILDLIVAEQIVHCTGHKH